MLRFQHTEYLWFLLSVVLVVGLFVFRINKRKKQLATIGDKGLVSAMMPTYSESRQWLRFVLIAMALFTGVIGLANLQAGSRSEKIERKGIDVMIALDVSKSMLAKDISPNRMEKAKQLINKLLDKLGNDRVGLIVFAGRAYVSVPLTIDFSALKMNLSAANSDMVPTQGTVIGEAISMARQSFNTKETKYKSIILISDGEDHDEEAMKEVKQAVEEGIMINTVGIGSPDGSPIVDDETGQHKLDENGVEIISKLNEQELQSIASNGQGIYQRLNNTEVCADAIATQINTSEQRNFGDTIFIDYNSYYQYFLAISLLLIIIESFIPERKKVAYA
jgi:Ca-activated chloride channel family protein